MTRVEEERAQKRYDEQKRLEKESRTKNAQGAEQFKKVVSAKQESTIKIQRRDEPTGNMSKQQQSSSKKGHASKALLAKSGFQSRDLQSELSKRADRITEQHHSEAKERDLDVNEKQQSEHEKQLNTQRDSEKHVSAETDRLAAIARDSGKKGGGEDAPGDSGGMMGGGNQMGMPTPQASPTADVKGSAGGARIPQNALAAIVKMCQVRVNPKGLTEFSIELRDDVLGGSKMNISANGRKINATFVSDDANVRRLLKASEGDLARAFDQSGLTLESFRVSAF